MAISMCKECRGKISTNADTCPHCGNKITEDMFDEKNVSKINGVEYDFTPIMDEFLDEEILDDTDKLSEMLDYLCDLTGCAGMGLFYLTVNENGGNVPKEYNGRTVEEMRRLAEKSRAAEPKCPTCNSTNIHKISFGERARSVNFLGMNSKKFNKSFECDDCGYTW